MKRCNSKLEVHPFPMYDNMIFCRSLKSSVQNGCDWFRPWKAERPHFGDSTPPPVDVAPAPKLQLRASVEVLEAFKFGNQWCAGNHLCSGGTIENKWKSLDMSGCWPCWPLWDIQPWCWNTARTLSVLSSAACSLRYSAARSRSRSPRRWYTVASCGSCAKQEALPLVGCCCSLLGVVRFCYLHPVLVLLVWWVI